ncbi:hypothetical protein AB0H97_29980 [Streptomyces sp. NPDC050788]|uniref:DUF7426 family protein n=1 Tax=Streptomyces sp. NPDC050788 TaxID=3155041 RepID=UPI00343311FD
MADHFPPLDTFHDDVLELPLNGRTVCIPSPASEVGRDVEQLLTRAARMLENGAGPDTVLLDDDQEDALYRQLLGDVYGQLAADEVQPVGHAVLRWVGEGRRAALAWWAERDAQASEPGPPPAV